MPYLNLFAALLILLWLVSQVVVVWARFRLPYEQRKALGWSIPTVFWLYYATFLALAQVWLANHHASSVWSLAAYLVLLFGMIPAYAVFNIRRQKQLSLPASYIKTVMFAELSCILCLAMFEAGLSTKAYFSLRKAEQLRQELQESQRLFEQSQQH